MFNLLTLRVLESMCMFYSHSCHLTKLNIIRVECKSTNFPADLAAMFVRQGVELSRRCVVPPAIEKKG